MVSMSVFEDGNCPECGSLVFSGHKEKETGWKIYVECEHIHNPDHDCSWGLMVGFVRRSDVDNMSEMYEKMRELVEQNVD